MLKWWFAIPFWQRVLAAFVLGVVVAVIDADIGMAMKPLGDLFISAIKMLVAPLIFCAIVSAITSLQSSQQLGRLGVKTIGLFLLTAVIASVIGLTVGSLLDITPTEHLVKGAAVVKEVPSAAQVLLNMVPVNPFAALAQGNVLQIVVFAALVGIAINRVGEPAAALQRSIKGGAEVMYSITRMVLQLTPLGVFGLMAWVVGSYGLASLLPLLKFVGAIYLACLLHIVLVYGSFVRFAGGVSPWRFFKAVFDAQVVAFTTCSSFGSLPAAHKAVTERLGVSKEYASFVLPLGATINMDGCGGIYPAIAAIFIAQLYNIPLQWMDYLLIVTTATLASVGTAGVPGTAMVMLTVTLNAVGLPLEGIAFVAAIDRVIDMVRTLTNVTGDMMVALVVGRSEGQVDEQVLLAADARNQ
ncbi:dicarboxylate/amino acid:cation symporter [Idiomarina xiamenensis]|uniref:Na+/H+-glutamate/aspartate symport protein n=1 Tax=Idiomarina xiamenensis 10-D-4 TaxID=740709 RepID=K2JK24_9GAMM|nr:dicarboxylate/amino acid:cation symporter [Idiomarina xiamenensis]EKE83791.1 Na+/H+ - glutamate/aspartate symport protein [Idiomarina xiamenensis 10-D-4]